MKRLLRRMLRIESPSLRMARAMERAMADFDFARGEVLQALEEAKKRYQDD